MAPFVGPKSKYLLRLSHLYTVYFINQYWPISYNRIMILIRRSIMKVFFLNVNKDDYSHQTFCCVRFLRMESGMNVGVHLLIFEKFWRKINLKITAVPRLMQKSIKIVMLKILRGGLRLFQTLEYSF